MKLRLTADKKFLQLVDSSQIEMEQLRFSFTKRVDNWFILRKKIPNWDGEICFMDQYDRIPIGLWLEVKKLADRYNFQLEIEGADEVFNNTEYNPCDFDKWVLEYFDKELMPRDYQIEACKKILKHRLCTEEISTSGGKTLITFMIFKYLFDKGFIKSLLFIVPNINLVTQTEEKFYEYEDRCDKKPNWKSVCVFSGAKKDEETKYNIVFGTFQSLTKKDVAYFKDFDAVCCDESHHASTSSIKTILLKCYNAKYKFGLSGTLPEEGSCNSFIIQSYLGPKVYELQSSNLIDIGKATPIHVIGIEMDYLDQRLKKSLFDLRNVKGDEKDGAKLLNLEKDTARENRKRFLYVCETINRSTKNSLVLFSDIKNSYGRNIYDWMRENTTKNVYYIDGSTKSEIRDFYKKKMEEEDGVILIASAGTFSEGVDIINLFNIYIVESHKSERIVAQILGRGMRLMEGKEKVTVIDFCDNYEYGSGYQKKNYLLRHAEERQNIYKKRKFPYKKFRIKL